MIVPDKKTEAYLNRNAGPADILRLCRAGLFSPVDFLRASALCRDETAWIGKSRRILAVLIGLSFLTALVFGVISGWHFFYTPSGAFFLALLFVVCSVFRRYVVAEYIGAGCVGALIFLTDLVFATTIHLYEQLFLMTVLLGLWAIPSQRAGIRLLPLIALNTALGAFGAYAAQPVFRINPDTFCISAMLANVLLLAGREFSVSKTPLFHSEVFRFVPLFFACFFLSAGMMIQGIGNGFLLFVLCSVFTFGVAAFYLVRSFDRPVCLMLLFFYAFWFCWILYGLVGATDLSQPAGQAVFLSVVSFLVGAVSFLSRRLFSVKEGDDNGD